MTTRIIAKGQVGVSRLGSTGKTMRTKRREISKLSVYQSLDTSHAASRDIAISLESDGELVQFVRLAPNAAMEVVKGLLLNLPYFYVAADDEFLNLVEKITKQVDDEARAVVEAVKRPHSPEAK